MPLRRTTARVRGFRGQLAALLLSACSGVGAEQDPSSEAKPPPPEGAAAPVPTQGTSSDPNAVPPIVGTPAGSNPTLSSSESPSEPTAPTGEGGPSNAGPNAPGDPVTSPGEPASVCSDALLDPGPSPLSLLTRVQYLNTLGELFGSVPVLDSVLTARPRPSTIGAGQGDISQVELEDYQRAAELIAADVTNGSGLDALAPCEEGREPRECARDFVVDFGAKAYRAPLTQEDDIERHLSLFDAGNDYGRGIELTLRGMLQSARFLYRVELGTGERVGDAAVALAPHEVAARLAYTFWDGPPNAELERAATDGRLSSPEGISAALEGMLADPRGATAVRRFLEALVQLDALDGTVKDDALYPEWRADGLPALFREQARHFFDDVLGVGEGRLDFLLTTPRVFADRALAPYYGVEAATDFEVFALDEERAAGLLTLPALLSVTSKPNESSPIYRGKFVREMLLCQSPPPPPPDIPAAPEVQAGVSTRERLRQHEVDPACSTCHVLLDPIGFGFEHYDAIGRYRETDGDVPVDATGEIVGTAELDGAFDGVRELAEKLGESREVRECVARQYFRFVFGRREDSADACSIERLITSFSDAEADLHTLPIAVVASPAFLYRRPIESTGNP